MGDAPPATAMIRNTFGIPVADGGEFISYNDVPAEVVRTHAPSYFCKAKSGCNLLTALLIFSRRSTTLRRSLIRAARSSTDPSRRTSTSCMATSPPRRTRTGCKFRSFSFGSEIFDDVSALNVYFKPTRHLFFFSCILCIASGVYVESFYLIDMYIGVVLAVDWRLILELDLILDRHG